MKNWKTSVFGTIAAVAAAVSQVPQLAKYQGILEGIAAIAGTLFALTAKDHDVVGGKRLQDTPVWPGRDSLTDSERGSGYGKDT